MGERDYKEVVDSSACPSACNSYLARVTERENEGGIELEKKLQSELFENSDSDKDKRFLNPN